MGKQPLLGLHQPTNQQDFEEMMVQVDDALKRKGTRRPGRPIKAFLQISGELKLGLHLFPGKEIPTEGSFSGDDLTLRIFDWFDKHYGDTLKLPPGGGQSFMIIRGDPYVLTLPKIWGTVELVPSKSNPRRLPSNAASPTLHVLDLVDDLTDQMAHSLERSELEAVTTYFQLIFEHFNAIDNRNDLPLQGKIKADLAASVYHVISDHPDYDLSKWSSLQATEKSLKGFIEAKTGSIPKGHRGHDIKKLAKEASSRGLSEIPEHMLTTVQCAPQIRYQAGETSLSEAWVAHHTAVLICGSALDQAPKNNN